MWRICTAIKRNQLNSCNNNICDSPENNSERKNLKHPLNIVLYNIHIKNYLRKVRQIIFHRSLVQAGEKRNVVEIKAGNDLFNIMIMVDTKSQI